MSYLKLITNILGKCRPFWMPSTISERTPGILISYSTHVPRLILKISAYNEKINAIFLHILV